MSDLISRQSALKILTDISYNHCPTAQASEAIDLAKTMVAVMPDAEPQRNCEGCRFTFYAKSEEGEE
jgi:hypothetical protein